MLKGSLRIADYPEVAGGFATDAVRQKHNRCQIYANGTIGPAITGQETIDGNGCAYACEEDGRPFTVRFINCKDVQGFSPADASKQGRSFALCCVFGRCATRWSARNIAREKAVEHGRLREVAFSGSAALGSIVCARCARDFCFRLCCARRGWIEGEALCDARTGPCGSAGA